jgi:hypothetical protein
VDEIPQAAPVVTPPWVPLLLAGQAVVVVLAALLAIPTGRRRTVRTAEPDEPSELDATSADEYEEQQ